MEGRNPTRDGDTSRGRCGVVVVDAIGVYDFWLMIESRRIEVHDIVKMHGGGLLVKLPTWDQLLVRARGNSPAVIG